MFKDFTTKEQRLRHKFNEITEEEEGVGAFIKSYLKAFAWAVIFFPFFWVTLLVYYLLVN